MSSFPVLPDVNFVETDAQDVIDEIIGTYEQIAGVTLSEADPRRLFLLSLAYIIILQRQQIDATGKSNLLYYAQGDYLDHLGAFRAVERLEASPALTTLRWTLSAPQSTGVGIPQGTRATHDNVLYWRTTEPATIPAGQTSVDVAAEAMTPGVAGNDLAPGTITSIVDPIPFVSEVENTTLTQGGFDRESDEFYRERIYQAPAAMSTAGPAEAYIYWALTANPTIANVAALSPSPGVVDIVALLHDGEIPDQSILDEIDAVLSDKTIRPLADRVNVIAPDPLFFSVHVTYYIRTQDQAVAADIDARVRSAVNDYIEWQSGKLGRDVVPDELVARVIGAGAKRMVETTGLTFDPVSFYQVAQSDGDVQVIFGGVEDE